RHVACPRANLAVAELAECARRVVTKSSRIMRDQLQRPHEQCDRVPVDDQGPHPVSRQEPGGGTGSRRRAGPCSSQPASGTRSAPVDALDLVKRRAHVPPRSKDVHLELSSRKVSRVMIRHAKNSYRNSYLEKFAGFAVALRVCSMQSALSNIVP